MKRKIFVFGLFLIVLAIISVGTAAYYTEVATAKNKVTTGGVSFQLHEVSEAEQDGAAGVMIVLPGDTIEKTVTVENTGGHPMYLRIALTVGVSNEELSALDCVHMDINTNDWEYRDGYYYYVRALEAGETTEPLFTKVFIDGMNVDNRYLGEVFHLNMDVFAVQSEHNGATPFEAQGWPTDEGGSAE